jgi:glycine cleavage system transcriptional repressor
MAHFAVAAVGADRPGIVSAVTGVFLEHGCNLEDTSMSVLRGHFSMMLIVEGSDGLSAEELEEALAAPARELDLVVAVRRIDDSVPASPSGEKWELSVYGCDRPGIVHRVASLLAAEGINIVDLSTRVIGDSGQPVYAMLLELTLPPSVDPEALDDRLGALAADLAVDWSLHPADADIL